MSKLTFLYQMDLPHRAVAVYTYLYDRANKNGGKHTHRLTASDRAVADYRISVFIRRRVRPPIQQYKLLFREAFKGVNSHRRSLRRKPLPNFR